MKSCKGYCLDKKPRPWGFNDYEPSPENLPVQSVQTTNNLFPHQSLVWDGIDQQEVAVGTKMKQVFMMNENPLTRHDSKFF